MTDEKTRFFQKVVVNPGTGCWEWQAAINHAGYGIFWRDGRMWRAHRVSWEFFNGPIPDGVQFDHRECKNKACVNPGHLMPCTLLENVEQADGAIGMKRAQTHCKRGHSLSGDSVFVDTNGSRQCRICRRARERKALSEGRRKDSGRKTTITVICEGCGQPFRPRRGRTTAARFCSHKCRRKRA